ncbi:MAG: acetaldehyde dehydrogenase (acetylating) [Eubacteriaceae bacterium]|jgi:acetaldehyde dehydrogenase|nr:acetaldehyde dehydrogenase (acetylating) [Eubacteriaceae bacterium]
MNKVKCGLIGPGNIGQDLMIKISRNEYIELACVVNIKESEGLQRARDMGIDTSSEGVQYILDNYKGVIDIVFDATSARAHTLCAPNLKKAGMFALDLTPAAVGPYCVPSVNLSETMLSQDNVNLVTCAGQATTPIVSAINEVADVYYAETVSSLSSESAGPGTRANIDEFTETTRSALINVGGADNARAIIILNPAEPPILMSNTIYTRVRKVNIEKIAVICEKKIKEMQVYVPGCRFRMKPTLTDPNNDIVMCVVEVEGAGDYLPVYSGNLDIINAAAIRIAEMKAKKILGVIDGKN